MVFHNDSCQPMSTWHCQSVGQESWTSWLKMVIRQQNGITEWPKLVAKDCNWSRSETKWPSQQKNVLEPLPTITVVLSLRQESDSKREIQNSPLQSLGQLQMLTLANWQYRQTSTVSNFRTSSFDFSNSKALNLRLSDRKALFTCFSPDFLLFSNFDFN